mgnify:FL=1
MGAFNKQFCKQNSVHYLADSTVHFSKSSGLKNLETTFFLFEAYKVQMTARDVMAVTLHAPVEPKRGRPSEINPNIIESGQM